MSIVSLSSLKVEKSQRKVKKQAIPNLSSLSDEYLNPEKKQTKKRLLKTVIKKCSKPTTQPTTRPTTVKMAILSLRGISILVLKFIFNLCRAKGSLTSDLIRGPELAKVSNASILSVRRAIIRLINRGLLIRANYKDGLGGWTQYELPQEVYDTLVGLKINSKPTTQPTQIVPSSSSDLNTTTTGGNKTEKNGYINVVIPEAIKKIGFGELQLNQLYEIENLSVENVQQSLNHFAFDFSEQKIIIRTNPLNFLMGSLRKGGYTSSSYINEEEALFNKQLTMLREKEAVRQREKKEYDSRLFEEWKLTKSLQEIEEIKNKSRLKSAKDATFKLGESMSENNDEVLDYFLKNERDSFEKEMFSNEELQ